MLHTPRRLINVGLALALFLGCVVFASHSPTSAQGTKAGKKHVTLTRALQNLQKSRSELNSLEGAYAGHREKAIKHIDQAIAELKKAIAVAEKK